MSESSVRNLSVAWWLLIATAIAFELLSLSQPGLAFIGGRTLGMDDANIYLRYARNVGALEGIVWNVGGERVEGFTSPLWLGICIAVLSCCQQPELILFYLNILLAALSILAAIFTCVTAAIGRSDSTIPPVVRLRYTIVISTIATACLLWWVSQSPPFIVWNILSLLDTGIWSALVMGLACAMTCYAVSGRSVFRHATYGGIVLLVVCRPEGGLLAAWAAVTVGVVEWVRGASFSSSLRLSSRGVALYAVSMVCVYTFRWLYFGFLLPNTYYAKVDGDRWFNLTQGWLYLRSFWETCRYVSFCAIGVISASLLAVVAALGSRWKGSAGSTSFGCTFWGCLVALGALVPLWVGGDHFNWWRFLTPFYLPVAVGLMLFTDAVLPARVSPLKRMLLASPLIFSFSILQRTPAAVRWSEFPTGNGLRLQFDIAVDAREMADHFHEIFRGNVPLPEVAVMAVGGFGERYQGPVYDLLALNNVEMAHASSDRKRFVKNHSAFNKEVFLRNKPPYLFFVADYCELSAPHKRLDVVDFYADAMQHIHHTPEFQNLYVPVVVWNERLLRDGKGLCGYALREELASGRPIFGYRTL
ncbi:MAG: hypothetical protein RL518_106 [Pseudomonadota bacterium]